MKRLRFKKIDAFSTGRSAGNPAGYVLLEEDLRVQDMQQVARELQGFVSEVGFVRMGAGDGAADLTLRYFSCEREVSFCGHATVAIMHDLISTTPCLQPLPLIRIQTRAGILAVQNQVHDCGMVVIQAPLPVVGDHLPEATAIAAALGLRQEDMDPSVPAAHLRVGQEILLIRLTSLEACITCMPEYDRLREFALSHGIEVIHISFPETEIPGYAFRVRVFAPAFGYLEDPATGSGNAAFGYHLLQTGVWDGRPLLFAQGPDRECPNRIRITGAEDGHVWFGGSGVVRIDGWYYLHDRG